MRHISPSKAGVAVGAVVGLWHLIWVLLVGVGWAKTVLNFILQLHFIKLQFEMAPYSSPEAALLVSLTFAIGFLFGLAFAVIWNWLTFEVAPEWATDTKARAATL